MAIEVYVEAGSKKTFACAVDWAGWCRAAKNEDEALHALEAYAERYRGVVARAGLTLPKQVVFEIVERAPGSGSTDFGAPGAIPDVDYLTTTKAVATRAAKVLTATWDYFDDVVAKAPATLRKGPRGGGRDRDQIAAHVFEAEASYVRTLGIKGRAAAVSDRVVRAEMRDEVLAVIGTPNGPIAKDQKGWPPRYAARRIAWHVLDHAWEIEDKS